MDMLITKSLNIRKFHINKSIHQCFHFFKMFICFIRHINIYCMLKSS